MVNMIERHIEEVFENVVSGVDGLKVYKCEAYDVYIDAVIDFDKGKQLGEWRLDNVFKMFDEVEFGISVDGDMMDTNEFVKYVRANNIVDKLNDKWLEDVGEGLLNQVRGDTLSAITFNNGVLGLVDYFQEEDPNLDVMEVLNDFSMNIIYREGLWYEQWLVSLWDSYM